MQYPGAGGSPIPATSARPIPLTQNRLNPPRRIREPAQRGVDDRRPGRRQAALDRLLAYTRARFFPLAMRVLGDPDEAEDAMQDALVKVWRYLDRFEGRSALSTWLHRIVVNAALDRLRRRPPLALSAADSDGANRSSCAPPPPTTRNATLPAPRRGWSFGRRWGGCRSPMVRRCGCAIWKVSRTPRSRWRPVARSAR